MYEEIFGKLSLEDIYIQQAFDYYRARLLSDDKKRVIAALLSTVPEEFQSHSNMGICDCSLGLQTPIARSLEIEGIRGKLEHCGLLTSSGGELFRKCIVFPERDEFGHFVSAVGYRYGRVRSWQESIIHWHKPEFGQYIVESSTAVKEMTHAKSYH